MIAKTAKRTLRSGTKHTTVYNEITRRIYNGIYIGKLPGVNQLGKEFDVNPLTISKVLNDLETDGLIRKHERVGTFVNRTRRIGFLVYSKNHTGSNYLNSNSLFDKIIRGVTDILEPRFYKLHLCVASPKDTDFINQLKREVDGLIIVRSGSIVEKDFKIFSDIPWILAMGEYHNGLDSTLITYNNDVIGRMAADYLLDKNCNKFLYYGFEKGSIFGCRWDNFMGRLANAGFQAEKVFVDPYGETIKNFFQKSCKKLESHLKSKDRIGIFLPSDLACHTLYQIIYKCGRTPEEVDIICCDNNDYNLHGLYPRPMSIDIRMGDIGQKAADCLHKFISGEEKNQNEHIILMPEIAFPAQKISLAGWEVNN